MTGIKNRYLLFAFVVFLGIATDILTFAWLIEQGTSERVYLRNLFFSEILSDSYASDETEINLKLNQGFMKDTSLKEYENFLPVEVLQLQSFHKHDDRSLAMAIVEQLGEPDGSICGLETLGHTVFNARRGRGCCSDYSKAFIFYANYLGLQAREVSLFNHATVEYLNKNTGRWQWLDPFHRAEIVDEAGNQLSLFQIRKNSILEVLKFSKIGVNAGYFEAFDYAGYSGYASSEMGTVMWRRGTNYIQVESWDRIMQGWGLSKSMRQAVTLVFGVQPQYLMLTTHSNSFYFKTLRAMLWGAACFWLVLNLALIFCLVKLLVIRVSTHKS
jgi:hypothetical protein